MAALRRASPCDGVPMLFVYLPRGNSLERHVVEESGAIPDGAVWFDLVSPTLAEDKLLERALGIAVPTREEMQEIEVSSRLYVENGARYMTATLMCQSDTADAEDHAGHLHPRRTQARHRALRRAAAVHADHQQARARMPGEVSSGETIMMDLLDAVIDRAADILERAAADIDRVSHDIFEPEGRRVDRTKTYRYILQDDRPQRRPDLKGAREPRLDRPPGAVSCQRGRRAEVAEGNALAAQDDAARRAVALRPRKLSRATRSPSCSTRCSAS